MQAMKLALLSARSDIHTVRWANGLAERGHEIHLLTMHPGGDPLHEQVRTYDLAVPAPFGYYLNVLQARRLLRDLRPDLLHAHFASGYGTLGRLSHYRPSILSVWGRDVYDFPYKSPLHRRILQANLRAADCVCSTSHDMARQTRDVESGVDGISITPFGVDVRKFAPVHEVDASDNVTIGTVKKLDSKYGIDVLIEAFALVRAELRASHPEIAAKLRLLIVGGGPERSNLEELSSRRQISDAATFAGAVPHAQVPSFLNRLDVYVAVSRDDSESFGVAVLEASACERPVVVSDVGGLPEVVREGRTGLIVPRENPEETAQALKRLVLNPDLRKRLGCAGRNFVSERYSWEKSVDIMEEVYRKVV